MAVVSGRRFAQVVTTRFASGRSSSLTTSPVRGMMFVVTPGVVSGPVAAAACGVARVAMPQAAARTNSEPISSKFSARRPRGERLMTNRPCVAALLVALAVVAALPAADPAVSAEERGQIQRGLKDLEAR